MEQNVEQNIENRSSIFSMCPSLIMYQITTDCRTSCVQVNLCPRTSVTVGSTPSHERYHSSFTFVCELPVCLRGLQLQAIGSCPREFQRHYLERITDDPIPQCLRAAVFVTSSNSENHDQRR